MGMLSGALDQETLVYVLTLGVVEGFRHQGVASKLIDLTTQHAQQQR